MQYIRNAFSETGMCSPLMHKENEYDQVVQISLVAITLIAATFVILGFCSYLPIIATALWIGTGIVSFVAFSIFRATLLSNNTDQVACEPLPIKDFSSLSNDTGQLVCRFLPINDLLNLTSVSLRGEKLATDNGDFSTLMIQARRFGYREQGGNAEEAKEYLEYILRSIISFGFSNRILFLKYTEFSHRKIDIEETYGGIDGLILCPSVLRYNDPIEDEIDAFLEHGGNIDAVGSRAYHTAARYHGRCTALYIAAHGNYDRGVKLLLDKGARHDIKSKYGWLPLDVAAWENSKRTERLLLERGAKYSHPLHKYLRPIHIDKFDGFEITTTHCTYELGRPWDKRDDEVVEALRDGTIK